MAVVVLGMSLVGALIGVPVVVVLARRPPAGWEPVRPSRLPLHRACPAATIVPPLTPR